jgi:hypothetical protein
MLQKAFPLSVKFICAFIYSNQDNYQKIKNILTRKFGPLDFESQEIDFNFTSYYEPEMGKPLWRRFISFKKLVKPDHLVNIKDYCIKLEHKFSQPPNPGGCLPRHRSVNIDPGYINEAKLVLTTTKDFHHRLYLGKGIFAEITLAYSTKEKNFTDFPTTFPDYRTPEYKKILLQIRDLYRHQIKGINA